MLDIDKIRWMMNRRDSRWWEEDSWEIYNKLHYDMYDTMDFTLLQQYWRFCLQFIEPLF
ncbi:hypothetical protein MUB24_13800 [Lederbergia sp. NSJ-179]|uniref:hypothetical protein n=1 Tax=Lederbergia sp. NSJ-179 TaxID=2931402 RepID=UPI001FD07D05|nr:hypothetical protein [Lederbergia sp. NSJ-179]MCJ7841954.1 hypothetical protein [Lederbergia sp. NSJ-179]